jgi:hypothetical protein
MRFSIRVGLGMTVFFFLMGALARTDSSRRPIHQKPSHPSSIQEINTQVAAIDQLIKNGLSEINISYEFNDAMESAPPSFRFFFEESNAGRLKLRACRIAVGHETWSTESVYYFDADEKPLKYRTASLGLPDTTEPHAIIFGKTGEVLWKNMGSPPKPLPQEILALFKLINKQSGIEGE